MEQAANVKPDQAPVFRHADGVAFVQGKRFVYVVGEYAEGLKGKALGNYVGLLVEEHSPYDIEKLYWGYTVDEEAREVGIWMIRSDQFSGEERQEMMKMEYVLPNFALVVKGEGRGGEKKFNIGEETVYVKYIDGKKLARWVSVLNVGEEEVSQMKGAYAGGLVDERLNWEEEYLLMGDLRDQQYKEKRGKEAKLSKLGERVFWGSLVGMGIVFIGLIGALIYWGIVRSEGNLIDERKGLVSQIESKENLVNKLEEISNREKTFLDMLEQVNGVRPKELYFTKLNIESEDKMEIEGRALQVGTVNQFVKQVEEGKGVSKVEVGQLRSEGGEALFKIEIYFQNGA